MGKANDFYSNFLQHRISPFVLWMRAFIAPGLKLQAHANLTIEQIQSKMTNVLETIFSNAFPWIKLIVFWLRCKCVLSLRVLLKYVKISSGGNGLVSIRHWSGASSFLFLVENRGAVILHNQVNPLTFSKGTNAYIYILCHSSTLTWHGYLKSFPV